MKLRPNYFLTRPTERALNVAEGHNGTTRTTRRQRQAVGQGLFSIAWFVVFALVWPTFAAGQENTLEKKVALPSENRQIANRLETLQRQFSWWNETQVASLCAMLGPRVALPDGFGFWLAGTEEAGIWPRLFSEYEQILREAGEDLLPLQPSPLATGMTSVQVRQHLFREIAEMPRHFRKPWQERLEAEAARLLKKGLLERSPRILHRVIEEYPAGPSFALAAGHLGDWAFERGQFVEARESWLRARVASSPEKLPMLEAKVILSRAFAGDFLGARRSVQEFRERFPSARGELAGKSGLWIDLLSNAIAPAILEETRNNVSDWTTFAGHASRNRPLTYCPPTRLWEDGPTWQIPLPKRGDAKTMGNRPCYHPVIVGSLLLLADDEQVLCHHLWSGKELFRYGARVLRNGTHGENGDERNLRFTLSVDRKRAFVRLGPTQIGSRLDRNGRTRLVCLSLDGVLGEELWKIEAEAGSYFEGAPLVTEEGVFVVRSILNGRRTLSLLECFDHLGRQRWSRELAEGTEFGDTTSSRSRHHLLTWTGSSIVYANQAGAVIAVEEITGSPQWAFRYPSRGILTRTFEPSPRDLAPCVYDDGRIFIAPADHESVFALDSRTGQVLWEHEGKESTHFLGVADRRAILATKEGVVGIDADLGKVVWSQPSEGSLPSLGRGMILGRWLLWPTQDAYLPYRTLSVATGQQRVEGTGFFGEPDLFEPSQLRALPPGNWAFGQGCLAIAGVSDLVVFVPPEKRPMENPIPDLPPIAEAHRLYRDGLVLADQGELLAAGRSMLSIEPNVRDHPDAESWRMLVRHRLRAFVYEARFRGDLESLKDFQVANWPSEIRQLAAKLTSSKEEKRITTPRSIEPRNLNKDTQPEVKLRLPLSLRWERTQKKYVQVRGSERSLLDVGTKDFALVDVETGKERWKVSSEHLPTVATLQGNCLYLGDPASVTARDIPTGELLWRTVSEHGRQESVTLTRRGPSVVYDSVGFVEIVAFDTPSTLAVLDDYQRWLFIDPATGSVQGQFPQPNSGPIPRLRRHFEPWIQAAPGGFFLFQNPRMLKRLHWPDMTVRTLPAPVPSLPSFQERSLIVPQASGAAIQVDPRDFEVRAQFKPPHPQTLTGEGPRIVLAGEKSFVAGVPRNAGIEWSMFEDFGRDAKWRLAAEEFESPSSTMGFFRGSLYGLDGSNLQSRSLTDGSVQWQTRLPGPGPWKVLPWHDTLVAYRAPMFFPTSIPTDASIFLWPFTPLFERSQGEVAVYLIDRSSGRIEQRIGVPSRSPGARVFLLSHQLVISSDLATVCYGPA